MADVPEAPAPQDQPVDAPETPNADQSFGGEESFTDSYNPSAVPEELRPQLEAAYRQMQGDYSKKTGELSEVRREAERNEQIVRAMQDPQTRASVLQQFGIDLVSDEDDDDDFADEPDLYSKVEQLAQWKADQEAQTEAARHEEAITDYVADEIEALEKSVGQEFDEEDHQLLNTIARAVPSPINGAPDVKAAYEFLTQRDSKRQKAFIESKKAPRRPAPGTPASQAIDRTNKEERMRLMANAADETIHSS